MELGGVALKVQGTGGTAVKDGGPGRKSSSAGALLVRGGGCEEGDCDPGFETGAAQPLHG